MSRQATHAEVRRKALLEARASVRADILLDRDLTPAQLLDRITKTIDAMIEAKR